MEQFIGRFHPVLVHLPISILLLALLFEALGRKGRNGSLQKAVPFALLLGAIAAAFSCVTGWLLSQNGEHESALVARHQWLGIGVAILSFSILWLKIKRHWAAYRFFAMLLLPGILLTGHWGITLTHGEGYLTKTSEEAVLKNDESPENQDVPDVEVSPPDIGQIAALQKEGAVVLPVGKDKPFLSLNFVNVPEITPTVRRAMEPLAENIVWLKLSGTALNDSTLALISTFKNLTRLHLDRTAADDRSLVFLQKMENLVYLNLVGTKVTAQGVAALGGLPKLRKLYLYQSGVKPEDLAGLQAKLPLIQIDTGGYRLPMLVTDTTFLPTEKKK